MSDEHPNTDLLFPIRKLKLEGALLCDGLAHNFSVQMVIDTGSGLCLIRRSFVERQGLPVSTWDGPNALLVSGQSFNILKGCAQTVDL